MKDRTPQNLSQEIAIHENFILSVKMGVSKCGKAKLAKHEKYVKELNKELREITDDGEDISNLSDADLLAELGL